MKKIQYNSQVSLAYQLLLEDGSEVEASDPDEPLECVIGDGTLTDGMEQALMDRHPGDSVQVTLSPDEAYGYPDAENIHNMPVADFPAELKPEPGQLIAFDGPDDEEIVGCIVEIKGDEVAVDFSHPLAGRTLIFKADILAVTDPE